MLFRRSLIAASLCALLAGPAFAADLSADSYGQCTFAEQSQLHLLPEAEIEARVSAYYDEASAALKSSAVVGSRSPAFLSASETKFQCGKAIGYLDGGTINDVSIQKCDCFYGRYAKYR